MGNSKSKKSQDESTSSSLPNGRYLPLSLGLLAFVGVPLPADASALSSISRLSARFEALSSSSRTRDNVFHSLANVDTATLATHNSAASCWLAIANGGATTVFDCTTYSNQHSGGPLTRFGVCGTQATNAYLNGSGRHNANNIPNKCVTVGALVATIPATNPPTNPPPATTTNPGTTTTTKPATTITTQPPATLPPTNANGNAGTGAAGTGTAGGTTTSYTMTDLATHNAVTDCWMSINDMVYDCTTYLPNHPGPLNVMNPSCGTNATTIFNTISLAHDATKIPKFCTMKGALLAVAVNPNAGGGASTGAGAGLGQTAAAPAPATQSWLQANPGLAIGVIVGGTVIGLAILIQVGIYVYKMHYVPRKQAETA